MNSFNSFYRAASESKRYYGDRKGAVSVHLASERTVEVRLALYQPKLLQPFVSSRLGENHAKSLRYTLRIVWKLERGVN
jgi:hypothetical protein